MKISEVERLLLRAKNLIENEGAAAMLFLGNREPIIVKRITQEEQMLVMVNGGNARYARRLDDLIAAESVGVSFSGSA